MDSIKTKIKKKLFNLFPKNFKLFIGQEILNNHEYFKHLNISFSQEGEDQILSQLFYGIKDGYYVDIGAHHPIKYSNTYKFYLNGWRGINIDAMPDSMLEFNKTRPNDVNLEFGVSVKTEPIEYHIFDRLGVNTFSKEFVDEMQEKGAKLDKIIQIKTKTLESILDEYLPINKHINFFTVDVENFELEVLKSNNWNKFRPQIIVVESLQMKNKKKLEQYLNTIEYKHIGQTVNNLYFSDLEHNEID